jgi:hypothetical protein
MLSVRILIRARCTTLCNKVCQRLAKCRWYSPGPPVPSTNKTDRHGITEILLKVASNKQTNKNLIIKCKISDHRLLTLTADFNKTSEHKICSIKKEKKLIYLISESTAVILTQKWKYLLISYFLTNFFSSNSTEATCTWLQHYVIKWPTTDLWFSPRTLVSSTNKTDGHDKTEILLKVVLNTITITTNPILKFHSVNSI